MAASLEPVLLLGHSGLVGQALLALRPDLSRFSGQRQEFDITLGYDHIKRALAGMRPQACINCIAMAHVDDCQQSPAQAWLVNSQGPAHVAKACLELNIRLIHISTDYVFNGQSARPYTEQDPCQPLNSYGQSKLAGELAVMLHNPAALVARTSWVFGAGREGWLERPWRQHLAGQTARVVDDQWACPTWAPDLAKALLYLLNTKAKGLMHVSGQGHASRLEACRHFFTLAGLDPRLIQPAKSADFASAAPRPAFSALDGALRASWGCAMLPWQEAIARHWQQLHG